MLSEDSVWCCIFPSYCKQSRNFGLENILKVSKSNIVPLIMSFVTIVAFTLIYFINRRFRNHSKATTLKKNLKVNQKTDVLLKTGVNQLKKSKIKASYYVKGPANAITVNCDSLKSVDFAVRDFVQTVDNPKLQAGEPIAVDATARTSIQNKSTVRSPSPLPIAQPLARLTVQPQ